MKYIYIYIYLHVKENILLIGNISNKRPYEKIATSQASTYFSLFEHIQTNHNGPLLLTWITFYPNMDNYLYAY